MISFPPTAGTRHTRPRGSALSSELTYSPTYPIILIALASGASLICVKPSPALGTAPKPLQPLPRCTTRPVLGLPDRRGGMKPEENWFSGDVRHRGRVG